MLTLKKIHATLNMIKVLTITLYSTWSSVSTAYIHLLLRDSEHPASPSIVLLSQFVVKEL